MMIIVFTLTVLGMYYYSYRAKNIAHRNQLVISNP